MAKKSIFRQESLDRLNSPEQLDQMIRVTSPTGWLALTGCILILVSATFWGFKGELPTNVLGQCILMKSGGIKEVTFSAHGRVTDLAVKKGDLVKQGQIIARVQQSDLLGKLRDLQQKKRDLISQSKANNELFESRRTALFSQIKALQNRISNREILLNQGLLTSQQVQDDKNNLQSLNDELLRLPFALEEIQNKVLEAERGIVSLQTKLEDASAIYSNYSGRIVEVMVSDGQLVSPGTRLLNLEQSGLSIKDLEAVIYVTAHGGKSIQPGMSVKLSPSTVKREEFGSIIGTVTSVSAYPATYNGMMSLLQNDSLVKLLSSSSASIQVNADLIPDTANFSGYKWTSPLGPEVKVESGTVCSAQITTRKQAPITLVIPAIRKFIGVY